MTDQEIIQALRLCVTAAPCRECPVVSDENCTDTVHTAAADAIERLSAENAALREKVLQWISVEERLPADHIKRYLVTFKNAGGSIVDAARYIPGRGWECYNWEVPQDLITHWMPLPGAPEGDKHE